VKPLLRRAEIYEETDKLDEALNDYKKLFDLDLVNYGYKKKCYVKMRIKIFQKNNQKLKKNFQTLKELEEKIKARNEKMKEEMMGKLKDLGNMFLKPFGLSTQNFQFVQDPNSGSYSVNFKK
jgi:hypothetical protein